MSYDASFTALTREFRLVVGAESRAIVWRDAHAARLGIDVGTDVCALALEGCEDKCRELLVRATGSTVTGWECALVLGGRPLTVLFSAAQIEGTGELAVLGSLATQDYADAISETSKTMHDLVGLHREIAIQKSRLEDSNTAIRSLLSELEQVSDRLRSTNEIKSRLIASMSHEFRSPLHSILGLTKLLLGGGGDPLTGERHEQVTWISRAASDLALLIDEMLELARIDSGRAPARIETFELRELLAAVGGTMRPLLRSNSGVELVIDPAPDVALETDHGKLAQIVRNLVGNALKFTTQGEVRVTAAVVGEELSIAVKDTGIGIGESDLARIFEEFVQIDSPRQREVKGSGLGLPLCRRLAESLGGRIDVASTLGEGSTFTVTVPMEHSQVMAYRHLELEALQPDPQRPAILVVEDDRNLQFSYDRLLAIAGFKALPARTLGAARSWLAKHRPAAILLDVMLEGEDTWNFLAEVKSNNATKDIPVLVCTVMNRESYARSLGADEFWSKPLDENKLLDKLQQLNPGRGARVLVIDDDATSRYLAKKHLQTTSFELHEAASGHAGLEIARSLRPDVILLDFMLDGVESFHVMEQLAADPRTTQIPVIVVTSKLLSAGQRERLTNHACSIIPKDQLSREVAIHHIREALR